MKPLLISFTFLALLLTDYTGTWAYTVSTAEGQVINANFEFSKEDGEYVGKITSSEGELPLKDLKIEGNDMSCNFYYTGYRIEVTGVFKDDVLNCTGSVEGYEFPMVAKKIQE